MREQMSSSSSINTTSSALLIVAFFKLISWFVIVGTAITLVSNIEGTISLAHWATSLFQQWTDLIIWFWRSSLFFLPTFPAVDALRLTLILFILGNLIFAARTDKSSRWKFGGLLLAIIPLVFVAYAFSASLERAEDKIWEDGQTQNSREQQTSIIGEREQATQDNWLKTVEEKKGYFGTARDNILNPFLLPVFEMLTVRFVGDQYEFVIRDNKPMILTRGETGPTPARLVQWGWVVTNAYSFVVYLVIPLFVTIVIYLLLKSIIRMKFNSLAFANRLWAITTFTCIIIALNYTYIFAEPFLKQIGLVV